MQSVKVRSRVGTDGILHLDIPVGSADQEFEVMVIYQPLTSDSRKKTPEERGWPSGFFERTAGAWQGEPLVRGEQGEPQERNWDLL